MGTVSRFNIKEGNLYTRVRRKHNGTGKIFCRTCRGGSIFFSVTIRIIISVICGGVLGIERGKANQSAGMRTYILVSLGATLVMLTGHYMYDKFSTGDPARLGAQVISGIGFLGAGSIIVEGKTKVRGLTTTAAGLWDCGLYWPGCGDWFLYGRNPCYGSGISGDF